MLKFYQHTDDTFSKKVHRKLEEMVVAHKIIRIDTDNSPPDDIDQRELPVLSDGHEKWTSPEEIEQFLEELHQDLKFSRSLKSDACYIDPDNPDQCL